MRWVLSHRADPPAVGMADRHYSRQKPGTNQFVPPGRCLVLRTPEVSALWVTSWPFPQYVKHAWGGAWVCSLFRNEDPAMDLSSDLVTAAVAATRWRWPAVPDLGMITFVDPGKTRRKRDPGRCFRRSGFVHVGETVGGLVALQLLPEETCPLPRRQLVRLSRCSDSTWRELQSTQPEHLTSVREHPAT